MRLKILICLLLAGITLVIYWPVRHFDLVYYDDLELLTEPAVAAGFTWTGLKWALMGVAAGNWHPVTNLSFVAIRELFGPNPGAEHLFNVLVHTANAVLLFLVLIELTAHPLIRLRYATARQAPALSPDRGEGMAKGVTRQTGKSETGGSGNQRLVTSSPTTVWLCAVVAGIFAWHPLRVESVAWIAERKDVLFMFFMLLSILCYTRYTECGFRSSDCGIREKESKRRNIYYGLALSFFVLSFMSKAMVVTLPFVLLLLDFWPLKRLNAECGVRRGPSPHPNPLPSHRMGGEGGQPAKETRIQEKIRQVTVMRLVMEKIPFFALAIVFSGVTFWVQKTHMAVASLDKVGIWPRVENAILSYRNYLEFFLWPNRTAVMHPYPVHFDTGEVVLTGLLLLGISAWCVAQIQRRPYLAFGWFWYLGTMVPVIGLVQVGSAAMADRYTYLPLIGPTISLAWLLWDYAAERVFTGSLLSIFAAAILAACAISTRTQLKSWQNSVTLFERDLAVEPENLYAHFPVALGLEQQGRWREAAVQFRIVLASKRRDVLSVSHLRLADIFLTHGYNREASIQLEAALQLMPDSAETMNNLAWLLATCQDAGVRNGARAVELAERACELTGYKQTIFIGTLAAAYAEAGRFDDAVATAQRAITNAQQNGETAIAAANQKLLQVYLGHKAYHEGGGG